MAKPIFILELPCYATKEQYREIHKHLRRCLPDYNVLGLQSQYNREFKYSVLNGDNLSNDKLKDILSKINE